MMTLESKNQLFCLEAVSYTHQNNKIRHKTIPRKNIESSLLDNKNKQVINYQKIDFIETN
jgi:hypothetical protein